jgi:hypothetical protein
VDRAPNREGIDVAEESGQGHEEGGKPGAPAGLARLTPYELAFMEGDFETRVFPSLREETRLLGVDATRRERLVFLTTAGDAVRELVPPEAPAEMLEEYRALFYHAYNFWSYGRRLYAVEPAVARYLVEAAPTLEEWIFDAPHRSLYLQLPGNLFWASIGTEVPPEPVDGFFVTVCSERDPLGVPFDDVQVLMVLGIHRHRAGFSVVPFETEAGPGIPPSWTEPGRERGADFENVLPGGEVAGLYSILTTAGALKLVARLLWYVQDHAEQVTPAPPAERRSGDRPGSAPLSRLEYHRVRLADGGA